MSLSVINLFGPTQNWLSYNNSSWSDANGKWYMPLNAVSSCCVEMAFNLMQPLTAAEIEVVWVPTNNAYFRACIVDYFTNGVPTNPVGLVSPEIHDPNNTNPVPHRADITAALNNFITAGAGTKYLAWQLYGQCLLSSARLYLYS